MEENTRIGILPLNPERLARQLFMAIFSTILLLIALLWSENLRAENINEDPAIQQEVAEFIQHLADKALTSLKQDDASLADQESRFTKILSEGFNVDYIGKISLGRYRKKASPENLKNYYALLPEYLVKVYTSRLTKLNTQEVRVGKVLPNGKRDMYVRTKVISSDNKTFDVDWRVRPNKKDEDASHVYKIIDVKIEGISMVRTQRDDFSSRITESGISGLISFMQAIVDGPTLVAENNNAE